MSFDGWGDVTIRYPLELSRAWRGRGGVPEVAQIFMKSWHITKTNGALETSSAVYFNRLLGVWVCPEKRRRSHVAIMPYSKLPIGTWG